MTAEPALPSRAATVPPKIVLGVASEFAGGAYRIAGPAMAARLNGYATTRVDNVVMDDEALKIMAPDVIVAQHQITDPQLAALKRYRQSLPGVFLVYEIDDMLWNIPATNPHKVQFPPDIKERIQKGISLCDRVVVSTEPMAAALTRDLKVKPAKIKVARNALPSIFLTNAIAGRRAAPARPTGAKPRVGWAGGDSHADDLALLHDVMVELRDEVEWVFMGMRPPEMDGVAIEYHAPVPMKDYAAALGMLDLDIALAPLRDTPFNACKSDLRVLELAAAGYAVIASDVPAFQTTPAYRVLEGVSDWVDAIRDYIANPPSRHEDAESLHAWAKTRIIESAEMTEEWVKAWAPEGKTFIPSQPNTEEPNHFVQVGGEPIDGTPYFQTIAMARAAYPDAHVVLVADNARVTESHVRDAAHSIHRHASISGISNDGDFPTPGQFTDMTAKDAAVFTRAAYSANGDSAITIPFPGGPFVVLSNTALCRIGLPDVARYGSVMEAIADWGVRATEIGMTNAMMPGIALHVAQPAPPRNNVDLVRHLFAWYTELPEAVQKARANPALQDSRQNTELAFWNTRHAAPAISSYAEWWDVHGYLSPATLAEMKADAESWEKKPFFTLVVSNDASADLTGQVLLPGAIETYSGQIDWLSEVQDGWLVVLDSRDKLEPHALYMLARAAKDAAPEVNVIYSDHALMNDKGVPFAPHFKPSYDYELLLAGDYIGMCAYRVKTVQAALQGNPLDEAAPLYDLTTRLAQRAENVIHLPYILWHRGERSEPNTHAATMRLLKTNKETAAVDAHPAVPGYDQIRFLPPDPAPTVSVLIHTEGNADALNRCLGSLMAVTAYPAFQAIIVATKSNGQLGKLLKLTKGHEGIVINNDWRGNDKWTALPSVAAGCQTEFVVFLNEETQIVEAAWLNDIVGAAMRPGVGAVGGRLVCPDGKVHTAGIMVDSAEDEPVQYPFRGEPYTQAGPQGRAVLTQQWSAVSPDCLCVRREVLADHMRRRENHAIEPIDFCLDLKAQGLRNLVVPQSTLIHYGTPTALPRAEQDVLAENNLYALPTEGNPNLTWGPSFSSVTDKPPALPCSTPPEFALLINGTPEDSRALYRDGRLAFNATLVGHTLTFTGPALHNVQPINMREPPDRLADILTRLGAASVVLRALNEGSIEALGALQRLGKQGIPVAYLPCSYEPVCPRRTCVNSLGPCGEAWLRGVDECQTCVDRDGSPAGFVNVTAYRLSWERFLDGIHPTPAAEKAEVESAGG